MKKTVHSKSRYLNIDVSYEVDNCILFLSSFSCIYILLILLLYSSLCTRFPCSLYRRGWDCTTRSVSSCVGLSLCVDVRLCRMLSCTWRVGALVSGGLASEMRGRAYSVSPVILLYFCTCNLLLISLLWDCVISVDCMRPKLAWRWLSFLNFFLCFNVSTIKGLKLFEPRHFPIP